MKKCAICGKEINGGFLVEEKCLEKLKATYENLVTELCPHCGLENTIEWNVAQEGYKAFCPRCGKRLMLCDECDRSPCDYNRDKDTCKHNDAGKTDKHTIEVLQSEIAELKARLAEPPKEQEK